LIQTGVVIVTYNSAGVIERCLDSCRDLPVVVVDNASQDNTRQLVERRSGVKLIRNRTNRGFASAVNQGVTELDTELILALNPDVELETPIDALECACRQDGVGLAGGRLVDQEGRVQAGFTLRRFPTPLTLVFEILGINRVVPPNPLNRRYRCLDLDLSEPGEVDQPPGALLMFRRDVWQRLGGFDTQFRPLWFEDVDFCKRARNLGVRIQYVPEVTGRHHGGHSLAGLDWAQREVFWYVSLLKYASKHFPPNAYRGVAAAVVLGSLIRSVIGMVRWRSLRPLQVYAKIAKFAMSSLVYGRVGEGDLLGVMARP
jgi:N-acetylglucosaminyl-diphospho-decaprenol L-rhamnosyltransferase